MDRLTLARRLRQLREEAGLSQQALAGRLGRTQSYVSKVEHEDRRMDLAEVDRWASACGRAVHWAFVDLDPEPGGECRTPDEDLVACVAWLQPRLGEPERQMLRAVVDYLVRRVERTA